MQTIFEKSVTGRSACQIQKPMSEETELKEFRLTLDLPELSELDIVRHYTALSKRAFGVDDGFYPLGSCTMKYNPKINELACNLEGFTQSHPLDETENMQGTLEVIYSTQEYLKEVTGFTGLTLEPTAGAHGELTALMMIKAYHLDRNDTKRKKILIPDSAHGTNPASAAMCGFECIEIPSDKDGYVDLAKLSELVNDETAGLMLTIPNTVGLFDKNILEISKILHEKGALLYMDGANLNAILGIVKPAEMGVDLMHINLHKTFSTPHGGGGPGGGFVGCVKDLEAYLPAQRVVKDGDNFKLDSNFPKSIGRVRAFFSNFGVIVRAYTYMLSLGKEGTQRIGRYATLNANYIRVKLSQYYNLPHKVNCMHEVVFNDEVQAQYGVSTMDIAKRLLDFKYHPPTIYFPLIVHGALMIEPTETESKQTMDEFIDVMIQIAHEAKASPQMLHDAPHTTVVKRVDAVKAARNPVIVCNMCCS
ncbi:MAG: glycine dehydrogenase subunit 2, glycine dehydrogenase subunit 2 [Candidatus Peregrinibacteria bacterium GW2011_GWF2_33_10]|nr:MAG: glycine dehydrogenase subunit 2, glycine dehydrogenase subunit 2 [Candidatus Peregrinibacteria bacterium GW2011_GWF2_33_10]OGJ45167.1 MAG: glycine dehydrogenase (aminomethyl-transferring) [Candidatus Peregrinibacteria bacterium RIFOXYA12_FULL_33_12]OGJ45482.1 MAG: glycine dehydrogenase (aminomethyl-transferring) [Candidatus Peregrinibacteria bacterium RIFOXYA2_FULL_33_21]OGJ51189.1 MAG: glycine dehydrogenase (aminomethyl-transferring) [Candidatus Peregrinibacteria bacterium RIFOXYB2_FULL